MSVLQPISYGLLTQVGPGDGAKGYGSYQADNTDVMRPYQQQAASPFGRGYPMGIISGDPTVYTPGENEDPIITLLKMLVKGQTKVVEEKKPDAGFKNNNVVFPPEGPAGDPPPGGPALGAIPAGDRPNAGPRDDDVSSAGDDVSSVEKIESSDLAVIRTVVDGLNDVLDNVDGIGREIGSTIYNIGSTASNVAQAGVAGLGAIAGAGGIPMTSNMASDAILRQLEEVYRNYLPAGTATAIIDNSRYVLDLILNTQRASADMLRSLERGISDRVYAPIQASANQGLNILIDQARAVYNNYGDVPAATIADIVNEMARARPLNANIARVTINSVFLVLMAVLNPSVYRRVMNQQRPPGLRQNPMARVFINGVPRIRGG